MSENDWSAHTESEQLVIVGAGGFGRETLDACLAAKVTVVGFLDDRPSGAVRSLAVSPIEGWQGSERVVLAVADPMARRALAERLRRAALGFATVIDPRAIIGPESSVGEGCVVLATAFVSSSVKIAEHVHINYGATIGHDAHLGPFSTVLPGASVAGAVQIGPGATVGSRAVVLQGVTIGRGATVGAGAVVTRDVAPASTVVGAPARPMVR